MLFVKLPWLLLLPRSWLDLDAGFSPLCWGCRGCPLLSLWPGKLESVLDQCYDRRKNRPGVRSHSRRALTGHTDFLLSLAHTSSHKLNGEGHYGIPVSRRNSEGQRLKRVGWRRSAKQGGQWASTSKVCATRLPCRPPGSPWRASSHSPAAGSETNAGPPQLPALHVEREHHSRPPEHCLEGPVREGGCGQAWGGGGDRYSTHATHSPRYFLSCLLATDSARMEGKDVRSHLNWPI